LFQAVDHIHKGYRRSVCGVDSIFYRVIDDTVEIIAILGQQDIHNIL
jgi:toxin ParE1/3/4